MNDWLRNLQIRITHMMQGRYGADALSRFLHIVVLICLVLSFIPVLSFLSVFAAVILVCDVCRTLSRNTAARRKELQIFLRMKKKVTDGWDLLRRVIRERKTHVYFRCPQCKAVLRVPKHRGEIIVTCPKCGTKIDKKT